MIVDFDDVFNDDQVGMQVPEEILSLIKKSNLNIEHYLMMKSLIF